MLWERTAKKRGRKPGRPRNDSKNDNSFTLPGGFTVSGATDEQRRILEARGRFAEKYAAEKGWDINNLRMEQLLEIRKHPDWKNPKA